MAPQGSRRAGRRAAGGAGARQRSRRRARLDSLFGEGDAGGERAGGDAEQDPAAASAGDLYELLGVERGATEDAIRRGYLKAALRWHPDKNPDDAARAETMFKQVAGAYQVLSDPESREVYDREGASGLGRSGLFPGEDGVSDKDMAFRFFRLKFPDLVPYAAFSETKLRELFPDLFDPHEPGGHDAGSAPRPGAAGEARSRL